jgi:protein-disulfide isomerase
MILSRHDTQSRRINMATDDGSTQLTAPVTPDDHQQGPVDAPVTVVMYGDYTSLEARSAHSAIQRLRQRFHDDLRIVFRHSRHRDAHPHAHRAAFLAEAAADHGHFWEMHDRLMGYPGALDDAAIAGIASEFELDDARFEAGHPYATRVSSDIDRAARAGIDKTPTIYINGRRHDGSMDEQTLQAAIEAAR